MPVITAPYILVPITSSPYIDSSCKIKHIQQALNPQLHRLQRGSIRHNNICLVAACAHL